MAATTLDLSDIQGDILRAYGNAYDCTSYVFVRLGDAAAGREWLGSLADRVTTAEPWTGPKPDTHVNVAVTAAGLRALGVPDSVVGTFSKEFRGGMAVRAGLLGDVGESDPSRWQGGLGTPHVHVLITVNAQTTEQADGVVTGLRAETEAAGGSILSEHDGQLLPSSREHFGSADGFAQPAVEGASDDKKRGGGVPEKKGEWRSLLPGEFILGYPDEDSRNDPNLLPSAPQSPLGRSGTYMVWRKLYQDVALWRRTMQDAAKLYPGTEEELSAKVVGRWPNGTPLVTHPDAPDPDFRAAAKAANDFRYDQDLDGRRCPIGAHIRRSNPRDALGFEGNLSFRHRLIRRGMPYGPELPAGETADDGVDRGLIFVCFQASISRQFEGVQVQWLNAGNIFHLGHDRDYLMGDPDGKGKMTIQGDPPFFLSPQPPLVKLRGGEYLFAPGITALRALAAGVT